MPNASVVHLVCLHLLRCANLPQLSVCWIAWQVYGFLLIGFVSINTLFAMEPMQKYSQIIKAGWSWMLKAYRFCLVAKDTQLFILQCLRAALTSWQVWLWELVTHPDRSVPYPCKGHRYGKEEEPLSVPMQPLTISSWTVPDSRHYWRNASYGKFVTEELVLCWCVWIRMIEQLGRQ